MKKNVKMCFTIIVIAITMLLQSFSITYAATDETDKNTLIKNDLITGEVERVSMDAPSQSDEGVYDSRGSSLGIAPFSIIGTDERGQISNTTISPYYGIAHIYVIFTDGTVLNGTGFMVSS